MKICVVCQANEAEFDRYLCGECAKGYQIDGENVQQAYTLLFSIWRAYIQALSETQPAPGAEGPIYKAYFIAPAVHFHNARRYHYFCRLHEKVKHIPGNVVECGVAAGQSLMYWASIVYDDPQQRGVWGFDSFSGPPGVTENDSRDGIMAYGGPMDFDATLKKFVGTLAFYGIPPIWINSHLTIVQGFFEKVLSAYDNFPIAILHLDCNYYESYKTCLDYFYPLVSRGGILVFDEYAQSWDTVHFPGAKKAIDEFLERTGEKIIRDKAYGKYFMIKEKA